MSARAGVTLEDLAKLAGVSRATASRVVRGDASVSPRNTRAVRAAVEQLGYVPNTAARALVTRRTGTIAVVIPEPDTRIFGDPFFARIIRAISRATEASDQQMVIALDDHADQGQRMEAFLRNGALDGAVVVSHHENDGRIERWSALPVPMVFVGRVDGVPTEAWVDVDNRDGGRQAARVLAEAGGRRPAIITGQLDMVAAHDRLIGFVEEWAELGVEPVVVRGDFRKESGAKAAVELAPLIKRGEIDGVFASSDLMALGAIDEWRRGGVSVPGDVRLVSIDDAEEAATATPALTTFTNPAERLGSAAVTMLNEILDESWDGRSVTMESELVRRESC